MAKSLDLDLGVLALAHLKNAAGDGRPALLGASVQDLESLAEALGEPRYRGRQLFTAIFNRRIADFAEMTDIPAGLRQTLATACELDRPHATTIVASVDGTRKYRFETPDGVAFESVYIPEVAKERHTHTLCVSSQSGCSLGCRFCFTASIKRYRNLTAAEIVGQVLAVQADVSRPEIDGKITNIVFMGMGEPLLNYDNVVRAAQLLTDPAGLDFSTRRVTISTAGIVPRIYDLGRDLTTQVAISLNASCDETRNRIMPINRKWPLSALIKALREYPLPRRRRFTIEYVMLGNVNDSLRDAEQLVRLLDGIPVKINLLPLNPHSRTEYEPPAPERVTAFQQALRGANLNAILRTPRGQDIAAACGQLGPAASPS